MRSRFLGLLLLLSAGGTTVWGQTYANDGLCCDPCSSFLQQQNVSTCQALGQFESPTVDCIEDPDCEDYNAPCTAIPIDGGLGLLALAGSGLAAARMRRRREEEGLAVEHVN